MGLLTSSSVPSGRRLAAELRRLRELAGTSGRDLAHQVGISQSTVSRMESGRAVPSLPLVRAWGKALGVSDREGDQLLSLAEAAHNESTSWRASLRLGGHLQDDVQAQEALARTVRVFQPSVIPGLLQTAEYARRVFSLFQVPYTDEDLADAVAGRLRRQAALYRTDTRFQFLITEAALRWRPGKPRLLLAQLRQISSIDTLDNVSMGVIPHDVEALTFTSHGFVIYDDEDDDPFVSVDTIHANIAVNDPEDVELYRQRWSLLERMAIFDEDAGRFLARIASDLRTLDDG
jgi:transcriptional regulator with XRE-family HTH domain